MKRFHIFISLLLCLCALLFTVPISPESVGGTTRTFVLPESLLTIGKNAFEGTGAESVVFSSSLIMIEDGAFANSIVLKSVSIPKSVLFIGEHAFENCVNLVVYGAADSYAAQWANEHNFVFKQSDSISALVQRIKKPLKETFVLLTAISCSCPFFVAHINRRRDLWKSMRPQDRPELYPINYRFP